MNDTRFRTVLARRGLHRSRSAAVSVALAIVALAAVALAALCLLPLAGVPLPFTLRSVLGAVATGPAAADGGSLGRAIGIGVGVVLLVLGLVALVLSLTPGRHARHALADDRSVVLVDDEVLAGAVSGRLARELNVAPDQVRTELGVRRLRSRVRPTSGHPVELGRATRIAQATVDALEPTGRLRVGASVDPTGTVGS